MIENEQFLTPEDFGGDINREELESINGHPIGDGQEFGTSATRSNLPVVGENNEDILKTLSNGMRIYKSDDLGEMYRPKNVENEQDRNLLEQTPIKDRYYLLVKNVVEQRKKGSNGYESRGFTVDTENVVVARILDENTGKHEISSQWGRYKVINPEGLEYFFNTKNGEKVFRTIKTGSEIWAPVSSEDKERRSEILKK